MVGGGRAHKLTTRDALTCLNDVKYMFHDNKEKYAEFLNVMKDFRVQRKETKSVTEFHQEEMRGFEYVLSTFFTEPYDMEHKY
ncbi:hypothetical protein L1987_68914 [Smallanthus sonchifolius]|uniref:Uncharacterized protein n=1 Tax=Smallanthus sonchifolius TaxID=185202 RepID=A0ACB9B4J5_9ASTR|nr:hypothetical protein L1987_68914 [Smallanthus sonchifolius]